MRQRKHGFYNGRALYCTSKRGHWRSQGPKWLSYARDNHPQGCKSNAGWVPHIFNGEDIGRAPSVTVGK